MAKNTRGAVSRRLRFEILRRDDHTCRYCGASAPDVKLEIDHVIPVTLGGSDEPSNLITACVDCNRGKDSVPADAPLVEDVAKDALRWKEAMERVVAERSIEVEERRTRVNEFFYQAIDVLESQHVVMRDLPADAGNTVSHWFDLGLNEDLLLDRFRYTVLRMKDGPVSWNQGWRYFCGCVWALLKDLHASAREELNEGDSPACG